MRRDQLDGLSVAADTAMVVVTAATPRRRAGCLVGFHTQSSIDPWRYAVFLSKANDTYRVARRAEHLCVHLLGAGQHELASLFGEHTHDEGFDKFAHTTWEAAPDGRTPRLVAVDRWFLGRIVARHHADGDHAAFVLEPVAAGGPVGGGGTGAPGPLRLSAVGDLHPGHPAG